VIEHGAVGDHAERRAVEQVGVEILGPEAAQAALQRPGQMPAAEALVELALAAAGDQAPNRRKLASGRTQQRLDRRHRPSGPRTPHAALADEDDLVAPAAERAFERTLAVALAGDVGGIEEVDSGGEGELDQLAGAPARGGGQNRPEVAATESEGRRRQGCRFQLSELRRVSITSRQWAAGKAARPERLVAALFTTGLSRPCRSGSFNPALIRPSLISPGHYLGGFIRGGGGQRRLGIQGIAVA
jgi:hypothetical protein